MTADRTHVSMARLEQPRRRVAARAWPVSRCPQAFAILTVRAQASAGYSAKPGGPKPNAAPAKGALQ